MTDWDSGYDVVIVGSGVAGLTAAVTAAAAGASPLVVEASELWGGTSALSAGGLWVPDNHLMRADGVQDSADEAVKYLGEVIGDVGPASSPERRRAYAENAPAMAWFLAEQGFGWRRAERWPDYHTELPGSRVGRMLEGVLFDASRLGPAADTMRLPETIPPVPLQGGDIADIVLGARSLRGMKAGVRTLARAATGLARNQRLVCMGQSLVAQLMYLCLRAEIPVRTRTSLRDLVVEDGRVTGVVVERDGRRLRIRARDGVLLAGGGFARADEFRRRYQAVGADWTAAIPEDTGEVIQIGLGAGGVLANMTGAWWIPVMLPPNGRRDFVVWERSHPGAIIVDQSGQRYCNESASYSDVGQKMQARHLTVPAVPSWLVIDSRHRRRYMFAGMPGGYTPREWIDSGYLTKASTLDELARLCDIPRSALAATVDRFNGFARAGRDLDFGRGDTVYDNYFGDPRNRPNPNLGALEHPPYYAVKLYPGDVGTAGGLLTDEHARVLRSEGGEPIDGLYAAGNTTASVMGTRYPGPGITLGAAATFGHIAMRHAVASAEQRAASDRQPASAAEKPGTKGAGAASKKRAAKPAPANSAAAKPALAKPTPAKRSTPKRTAKGNESANSTSAAAPKDNEPARSPSDPAPPAGAAAKPGAAPRTTDAAPAKSSATPAKKRTPPRPATVPLFAAPIPARSDEARK